VSALLGDVKLFLVLIVPNVPVYVLISGEYAALRKSAPGLARWLSSLG
jgi:hypothetical protein